MASSHHNPRADRSSAPASICQVTASSTGSTAIRALVPNSSRQTVWAAAAVRTNSAPNQSRNSPPVSRGKKPRPPNSPACPAQRPNSQAASESPAASAKPSRSTRRTGSSPAGP